MKNEIMPLTTVSVIMAVKSKYAHKNNVKQGSLEEDTLEDNCAKVRRINANYRMEVLPEFYELCREHKLYFTLLNILFFDKNNYFIKKTETEFKDEHSIKVLTEIYLYKEQIFVSSVEAGLHLAPLGFIFGSKPKWQEDQTIPSSL